MLIDFIIGIIASLIASAILGFLGNKAIAKHDDNTIMKIYVLFLSAFVFVVGATLSIILNSSFLERVMKMTEVNMLKFYHHCIYSFVWLFGMVLFVTLVVLLIEAAHRSSIREHKEDMDRLKKLK